MRTRAWIRRFLANERGATAIEYGIICGMIAVIIVAIAATGGALDVLYDKMAAIAVALVK